MSDRENRLKTLLLTLCESDLLEDGSIDNLFSRFPAVQNAGIETVIVHIDLLPAADTEKKKLLIDFFEERLNDAFQTFSFDGAVRYAVFSGREEVETASPDFAADADFSVLFSLGLGGRDELKRILSTFIRDCKLGKTIPSDMTPDCISSRLLLPFEPDLILSSSKNRLSDFMIWQTVYSEYYFMDKSVRKWTDADLAKAFRAFQNRDRRYGV